MVRKKDRLRERSLVHFQTGVLSCCDGSLGLCEVQLRTVSLCDQQRFREIAKDRARRL